MFENIEFRKEAVFRGLEGRKKKEFLRVLCERAAAVYGLDPAQLAEEVWKRETIVPTCVGEHLAIPHCQLKGLDRIYLAFALWPEGVDFGPTGEEPIQIAVLVIAPLKECEADYLSLLAFLARVFRRESNRQFLLSASADETLAWLEENAT